MDDADWLWAVVWCSLAGAVLVAWASWRGRVKARAATDAMVRQALVEHYRRFPLGGIPGHLPPWHPDFVPPGREGRR